MVDHEIKDYKRRRHKHKHLEFKVVWLVALIWALKIEIINSPRF
jgi:uncharacterized membrane protein YsdA (DUF1294 family)